MNHPSTDGQARVLETAARKLVVIAGGVGLGIDDLIELLDSGMSVKELLDYIGAKVHREIQ